MKVSLHPSLKGTICGAVAALALTAPAPLMAFSIWDNDQELDIESNAFNQVLFYDYATGNTSISDVAFGDREIRNQFVVKEDNFTAAFLFDYAEGRFTTGFYATTNSF